MQTPAPEGSVLHADPGSRTEGDSKLRYGFKRASLGNVGAIPAAKTPRDEIADNYGFGAKSGNPARFSAVWPQTVTTVRIQLSAANLWR